REAGHTAMLVTQSEDEAQLMTDKNNYLKNGRLNQNDEKTKIRNT
ncbi:ABC transporter ATP-binding protein, partial [Morganella morganii]|nr:ABC transporter ATP-binding protein [Morganella morganii]